MKKIASSLFFILVLSSSFSQNSLNSNSANSLVSKTSSDSLNSNRQSNNINHSGEINIKSNKQSIIEFLLPSFIALLIGGSAFYATLITSKRQLTSNKEALEKQIHSSLEIAKLDFRKNVLSDNRQAWINELRNIISELISLFNLNIIDPDNVPAEDLKKIKFLIIKAELMLNPVEDIEYIDSIKNLENILFDLSRSKISLNDFKQKIETLKSNTKSTLKTEWERVKSGE